MIVARSRYQGAPVIGIRNRTDGVDRMWIGPRIKRATEETEAGRTPRIETVRASETIDQFALRTLGRERLFWAVVDLNPDFASFDVLVEGIIFPDAGTRLLTPAARESAAL